ncbi:ABC transporter ATP-binding protein [Bacillus licheniformis]|uniref:ABC transporter ATP-binding protein n=1 Tax=Bacillus licheniformis TaxID=1402 RepID=UPI0011BECFE6|nr:ABC transporter ATP-binding protein [Bacillus licheniformis]MCA1184292.1 ABC transporter ATP-binding protein [Bacillus licheniformis]MCY7739447.1 ABC transporter ATP-binding protein [Bacillus licheniformis]TWK88809.1 putative ABC transporter ATP-binding protein YlmA [Bacillus licheniformis]
MVLQLEHASLKRNGEWILKDIDWTVEKGEHWALYGLNGAGKTALLNMLCAYYFPTIGKVTVLGREFGKTELGEKLRRKIGLVSAALQQKLYPEDSAFEIVLSGAFASIGLYESPSQSVREKAVALLEEFGSIRYADRRYETLSQGEKQKVLIARALMADPELLILDEPVTGLDFIAREQVLDTVEQIAKKDSAPSMLYVTHHAEEILPTFSQTLLLKKGEVFALGKTREMMSGEVLSEFFDMPVQAVWTEDRPYLSKKKTANLNV